MVDLTSKQIKRQDTVDQEIYDLICRLNPSEKSIQWDIRMITDVRLVLQDWYVNKLGLASEMSFYPYYAEGEDA